MLANARHLIEESPSSSEAWSMKKSHKLEKEEL
jgi:hypothetical protein